MEVDMEAMMLDLLPGLGDILDNLDDLPSFGDHRRAPNLKSQEEDPEQLAQVVEDKEEEEEELGGRLLRSSSNSNKNSSRVYRGWPSAASACANARAAGPEDSIPCGHTLSSEDATSAPPASPPAPNSNNLKSKLLPESISSAPAAKDSSGNLEAAAGLGLRHALPRINCPTTIQDTSCGVTMSSPKYNSTGTVGSPIFNEIARLQIHSPTKKAKTSSSSGSNGSSDRARDDRDRKQQQDKTIAATTVSLPATSVATAAAAAMSALTSVDARGQSQLSACGVEVVHILLACAEAVAAGHPALAGNMLSHLKRMLNPHGTPMQRVATYFTNALSFRLGMSLPIPSLAASAFGGAPPEEAFMAYQVFYACCPYLIITHFCANQAILEAFEGESKVHIVDLDIKQGLQWPSLIQALSLRKGGPPALRITAVGGPHDMPTLLSTAKRLTEFAESLLVPFEFTVVAFAVAEVQPWMVEQRAGEVLAVNCVSVLHTLVDRPHRPLHAFLAMITEWEPVVVTLVEQDGSHNESFIPRFVDALHYYSSMFDSLASTLSSSVIEREMVEAHLFGNEIMNIVGCEGDDRYMRHLPVDTWFRVMADAGFHLSPLSPDSIYQARFLVSRFIVNLYPAVGNYRLTDQDGYLSLGWQENPLYSVSCWC